MFTDKKQLFINSFSSIIKKSRIHEDVPLESKMTCKDCPAFLRK